MSEYTDNGFKTGSMNVSIVSSDKDISIVSIETPKHTIKIRATKTGQLRFFYGSQEVELVDKEISRSGFIEVNMIKKN